jgi:hypothetical protein
MLYGGAALFGPTRHSKRYRNYTANQAGTKRAAPGKPTDAAVLHYTTGAVIGGSGREHERMEPEAKRKLLKDIHKRAS